MMYPLSILYPHDKTTKPEGEKKMEENKKSLRHMYTFRDEKNQRISADIRNPKENAGILQAIS
jgi:hypothetical protein